jgi:integrase
MPKRIISLTDLKVKNAKSQSKNVYLFDGGGLYCLVTPSGGKLWRFKYRFDKKEKRLTFGSYPAVSLIDARQHRDEAKKLLSQNIDPDTARKAQKQASISTKESFEVIAREWFLKYQHTWAESHSKRNMRRLERDVFPYIGQTPIAQLKASDILGVLRRVEARGTLDTAHRIKFICGQVFRYSVATGRAERDPTGDLKGAIPPPNGKNMAAITDPAKAGELLRAIDGYTGGFVVQCALKLAPLVFVRPGELRHAEWSEIDFENAQWSIPAEKMKIKEPHIVPLSTQAIGILESLKPLTGNSRYVFPSGRSFNRCMSDNAILAALRRMGFEKAEMSGHGFRAMARTILDEVLQFRPELIEHQLAHQVKDPLGRSYNRTQHMNERRAMMQRWADYLDVLKQGAVVLPFRPKGLNNY